MGIFDKLSGKKKARAQKIEKAPEKKQLEGPVLVGTNVLEPGPWKEWTPKPPVVYKLRNLVFWSLRILGGEDMVIDRVGRHIYVCSDVLKSICRLDFDGNPDGLLRLPCPAETSLRISHDGKLLVSSCSLYRSWLYRVDPEGQVISAVENPGGFDVFPDGTIVGVSNYEKVSGWCKTLLRFVQGEKVHEVDVSKIMIRGHMLRCSPDGFLYVVGAPPHTDWVANTVFKFDPTGNLVNSCSIFRQIGATHLTRDGGIDVLEIDGDRLVRLSREMKVVYDSQRDSRPEALLFRVRKDGVLLLWNAHAIDTDDAGNCFVLAHDELMRFKRFWAEPSEREAGVYSDDKGELLKAKRDVEGLIKVLKNDTLKCKNCGFVNKEGSNFCENCGSRLSQEEPRNKPNSKAKAHYDRGIQFCEEYMWKGGIGDGAYVAIHRAMEEFKVALKLNPNFQLARLALADCYFCCPNSFDLNPFDAALLYQEAIKSSPDLIIDKDQASLGDKYMKQGPIKGYEAAVAYRKAMKREPVIWR